MPTLLNLRFANNVMILILYLSPYSYRNLTEKKKEHYNYLEGIWAVVFKGDL